MKKKLVYESLDSFANEFDSDNLSMDNVIDKIRFLANQFGFSEQSYGVFISPNDDESIEVQGLENDFEIVFMTNKGDQIYYSSELYDNHEIFDHSFWNDLFDSDY